MIRLDEDGTHVTNSDFPGDVVTKGLVILRSCRILGTLTAEDETPEFADCLVVGHLVHPNLAKVTNCIAYAGDPKGTPRVYAVKNPLQPRSTPDEAVHD